MAAVLATLVLAVLAAPLGAGAGWLLAAARAVAAQPDAEPAVRAFALGLVGGLAVLGALAEVLGGLAWGGAPRWVETLLRRAKTRRPPAFGLAGVPLAWARAPR